MAYKNPVPRLGDEGKKWIVEMQFSYDDWVNIDTVKQSLEEWIKLNGIPLHCINNITPIEEYR